MGLDCYLIGFKKKNIDGEWVSVEIPSYMLGYVGRRTLYRFISEDAGCKHAISEMKVPAFDEAIIFDALRYDLLLRKRDREEKEFNDYMLHTRLGLIMNVLECMRDEFELKADELCCVLESSF